MKLELRPNDLSIGLRLFLATIALLLTSPLSAQGLTGTENGEWRYLGGDIGHTRSSTLDQINRSLAGAEEHDSRKIDLVLRVKFLA